jgi:mevalonate pyrophosphate decarboxylase
MRQNNYLWIIKNNTIMGALELRDSVLKYINTADERLLKVVKAVIESYQENDIVTYTIDGKPLTRVAYKEELQEAKAEIKRGEYITQEDLEKESNNW